MPGLTLKNVVLVWLLSEFIAFAAVIHVAGWLGALLLGVATSALGVIAFRQVGRDVAERLRRTLLDRNGTIVESDVMLAALGAFLLIIPGFVSDLVGIALSAATVRAWVRTRVFRRPREHSPDVVELDPRDWRETPDSRSRIT